MASFGRSCEKFAGAVANLADGLNTRLDENHLIDMLVTLNDEDISVSRFSEFTETIQALRKGKAKSTTKPTTDTTGA